MDHNKLLAQVKHDQYVISGGIADPTTAVENYITLAITFLSTVAIIFFSIQIILAGYSFMNSKGDVKNMEVARNRLTQSILGLTLIIIATGIAALIASTFGIKNVFNLETFFTNVGLPKIL